MTTKSSRHETSLIIGQTGRKHKQFSPRPLEWHELIHWERLQKAQ